MDLFEGDHRLARDLIEAAPDALLLLDAQGRIMLANAQAEALFGYPRGELLGSAVEILVPELMREVHAARRDAFAGAPSVRAMGGGAAFPGRRRDGSEILAEVNLSPVHARGDVLIAASVRDASERRRMERALRASEEALRRSEEQLRVLIELAPEGIGVTDPQERYTEANAAFCRMVGYTREELLGKMVQDVIPTGDAARLGEQRQALFTPGAVLVHEWSLKRRDGSLLPVEVSATRLPDGRRQAFVRDISERKRLEREREAALAQLEQLRNEWVSVVAHDLQQPVAAVRLYAGLLDRVAARDAEAREPVARIMEITGALGRMITDLLDLSRVEVGQLPLWRRPVDLTDLVQAVVERVALIAADRALDVQVRGEIPGLSADPDRVMQVVENLLTNAVKYGAPGTPIVITVEHRAGELAVAVTNRGEGIAPEDLPHLFRRFQRGGAARGTVKGAGLGLHIARQLVEAHGGHLTAESEPGGETTFRFTLPLG